MHKTVSPWLVDYDSWIALICTTTAPLVFQSTDRVFAWLKLYICTSKIKKKKKLHTFISNWPSSGRGEGEKEKKQTKWKHKLSAGLYP